MDELKEWLTTIDNPFSPFVEWDDWYRFDTDSGYNTCGLIDRIANTSDSLSEYDNDLEVIRAMNSIVKNDPLNNYIRIRKDANIL